MNRNRLVFWILLIFINLFVLEIILSVYFFQRNTEYPLAIVRLNIALEQARKKAYLGNNIMGIEGFNLDIYVKEGAGAFVCGEETALIASVEGERGMPRSRPPYPATSGLFGRPTNINNVETLATVPNILRKGSKWYAGFYERGKLHTTR